MHQCRALTRSSLAVTMLDAFLGLPFSLSLPVSSLPICTGKRTTHSIPHAITKYEGMHLMVPTVFA